MISLIILYLIRKRLDSFAVSSEGGPWTGDMGEKERLLMEPKDDFRLWILVADALRLWRLLPEGLRVCEM